MDNQSHHGRAMVDSWYAVTESTRKVFSSSYLVLIGFLCVAQTVFILVLHRLNPSRSEFSFRVRLNNGNEFGSCVYGVSVQCICNS